METASEIYMTYVRSYMWILLLAGLAVMAFHRSEHSDRYAAAYKRIFGGKWYRPDSKDMVELWKANFLTMFPIVVWIGVFGIIATVLDVLFGPA